MRTVVYSLSALCLVAIGLYSAFAKPPATPFDAPRSGSNGSSSAVDPFSGGSSGQSHPTQRPSPHVAHFLELSGEYSRLLDSAELLNETKDLQRKLYLKRSALALGEVREQLTEIVNEYPSTPSAEQAQQLLNGLNAPVDAADEGDADALEDSGPDDAVSDEAKPLLPL